MNAPKADDVFTVRDFAELANAATETLLPPLAERTLEAVLTDIGVLPVSVRLIVPADKSPPAILPVVWLVIPNLAEALSEIFIVPAVTVELFLRKTPAVLVRPKVAPEPNVELPKKTTMVLEVSFRNIDPVVVVPLTVSPVASVAIGALAVLLVEPNVRLTLSDGLASIVPPVATVSLPAVLMVVLPSPLILVTFTAVLDGLALSTDHEPVNFPFVIDTEEAVGVPANMLMLLPVMF